MPTNVLLNLEARITKLQKDLTKAEAEMKNLGKQSDKTQKQMQGNFDKSTEKANEFSNALKSALTIGAAVQIGRHILNVRKEFERYETVLRASLGSQEAANKSFKELRGLASTLPFSVAEITDSFIKLINQGFKPTMDEMRKLADVAAVMGKSFDQLTEAIIDAQVGEFERLKEFGIRASKAGDQVTFTFRGIQTQVGFTADAIRGYILSLGDLEGVQGATAELAGTLGGQLSMLTDATDALSGAIGGLAETEVKESIDTLTDLSNIIATLIRIVDGFEDERFEKIRKRITSILSAFVAPQLSAAWRGAKLFRDGLDEVADGLIELEKTIEEGAGEKIEGLVGDYFDVDKSQFDSIDSLIARTNKLAEEARHLADIREEGDFEYQQQLEAEKIEAEEAETAWKNAQHIVTQTFKEIRAERERDAVDAKEHQQTIDDIARRGEREREEQRQKDIEDADSIRQKKLAYVEEFTNTSLTLTDLISARNEAAMNKEIELAGDNEEKKEAIRRKYAIKEQGMAVARALMAGAEGIVKTGANLGYPAAIPFQILQGIQTLMQIGIIKAQKFERGGFEVLKGRRHYQGGIQVPGGEAEGGEGHAYFSRRTMDKYGDLLPGLVAQINAGKLIATDRIRKGMDKLTVSLDDSNQLEEIRKLLAQKDKQVTFVNGYRIEKFNNVVRRIKV